ncbi:hypothetical protein [Paenibacillus sp. NPDC058071]|uniref:hypothetical protein n=1 Tax=Paenibacillus sp. NPDC058071 TaxID=3346326 RepID=UPI0036DDB413
MWKMTGWLAKTVAAGLIISFLSIWTTGYIVNSYVETLLKQYNLPIEVQPMALSGVWGKLWGAKAADKPERGQPSDSEAIDKGSQGQGEGVSEGSDPASVDAFAEKAPITGIGGGGGSKAAGAGTEAGEGIVDENGSGGPGDGAAGGQAPSIDGTETAITTERLGQVKEEMTEADKEELFGLLMSKLPQEAWQTISLYMENGLTDEELTAVQQIMAQHLDKQQYEQMMNILKKY